jgi:ATP-dependent DNA helicase RecG
MLPPMRPEILFPLFAPVTSLKGVGARLAPLLERLAGPIVRDLLFLKPTGVILRERCFASEAVDGAVQTFEVEVDRHFPGGRIGAPYRIRVRDETGFLHLTYFKVFGDGLHKLAPVGAHLVVSGKVERFGSEVQIPHPAYVLPVERAAEMPDREPLYGATAGLPSRTIARLVQLALARTTELPEWQDPAWRTRRGWSGWREAMTQLHAPRTEADLDFAAPARQRLAYDELLAHQIALAQRKAARIVEAAPVLATGALSQKLEAALPFRLTGAQVRAVGEIRADLASGRRMGRLLQGDVGSGKTVVALLALADAAGAGAQGALMAPTEILSRQHYERLAPILAEVGIEAALLTGRDKGAIRRTKLAKLADGSAKVVIGTHALFQDEVAYANLALAVIDEQHRFGVAERRRLQAKGQSVHLLSMSATPIPRTLELTQYGDLEVSRLDEKPPGRKPIATRAVPMARVEEIAARLDTAAAAGAQAYWICPLVAESELIDLAAAEARAADLKARLKAPVGLVHGQMAPTDKDAVMAEFAEGRLAVLVATTVVEVGVDVPKATIMVIEQAERFGLAQLHQLRGRVGRGAGESACILLYDAPLSEAARTRLDVLRQSEDGFAIAEQDWTLRGGGDALGLKQSGFPDYRLADPVAHRDLLYAAADDARLVLQRDPRLESERGQALRVLMELFDWRPDAAGPGG